MAADHVYVSSQFGLEESIQRVCTAFPKPRLTWSVREDPGWGFIRDYSERFGF